MSTGSIDIPVKIIEGNDTLVMLARIANALESTGKSASEADPKVKTLGERFAGLGTAARHFNEVAEFAGRMSSAIMGAAERIGELAAEQSRLDRVSAQTGLNLDEAAAAAGRFADETEAASVAGRLFQAGTRMTQEQLNALMRVAGAASHTLGVDTAEAVNRLTDGLLSGSQRALRPFGADLAAAGGESHTMADRLGALVTQANHTTTAVDDAHDSVKRFQDAIEDSQRTVAAAFATEFARLSSLGTDMNNAADGAEDFNRNLQAVGQTAALIVSGIANGIGVIIGGVGAAMGTMVASIAAAGSAISAVASGNFRGAGAAARRTFEEYTSSDSITGQFGALASGSAQRLNALADDTLNQRTTLPAPAPARPSAPPRPPPDRTGGGGRDRYEELRARIEGEDAVIQEDRRLRVERRDAEERFAKARAQEEQRAADRRLELERAMRERANDNDREASDRAYQRSDAGIGARAGKDRDNAREARDLDHRYQQHRGFTERMEELSHRRIYAAQEEADSINGAFGAMGRAFSDHLTAVIEGREELGTALQGMLSDTLLTIAKESSVKAGLNLAEGFAALATYRYDAAAEHFAAAGIYTGVAVAAGLSGAAVAPAAADKGSAAPARRESASPQGAASAQGGGGTVINVAFNGPQFGTGGVVQAARELAGVLNSGAVQGGVQINRLAVAGMGGR